MIDVVIRERVQDVDPPPGLDLDKGGSNIPPRGPCGSDDDREKRHEAFDDLEYDFKIAVKEADGIKLPLLRKIPTGVGKKVKHRSQYNRCQHDPCACGTFRFGLTHHDWALRVRRVFVPVRVIIGIAGLLGVKLGKQSPGYNGPHTFQTLNRRT